MKLTPAERRRWAGFAGCRLDPYRDRPIEEITVDGFGRARVDSTVACGVYVVLDPDDEVVYVGKVDRRDGSTIAERFCDHHALADDWDRVWILPLKEGTAASEVLAVEGAMIKFFCPHHNKASRSCQ